MLFKIKGKVYEKETGRGLSGLRVRAYDKDLFFDDLLGSTVTDAQGKFEIEYAEKDFRELFEKSPDIYFTIYTANFHKIADTRKHVRWNAGHEEYFEIDIPRKDLNDGHVETPDDVIQAGVRVPASEFKVKDIQGFKRPELPGFAPAGLPGEPALPSQFQYLVMPLGSDILDVEVVPGEPVIVSGIDQPMPVQEPYPDLGSNPDEFADGITYRDIPPTFTPLKDEYLKAREPFPRELVQIEAQEAFGHVQLASVKVSPVQYDARSRSYLFYPNLSYRANLKLEAVKHHTAVPLEMGYAEAELLENVLAMELAFPAKDLQLPGKLIWEEAQHVIITDNYQWPESVDNGDGTTRSPGMTDRGTLLNGNLVAEFDRLAQWKTARGVRSKLVTVSQIVGGTFGDLTQGGFARDLQEVIRNFVKYAKANWKATYFLMAGDYNVVPIRKLCGSSLYPTIGVNKQNTNPPAIKTCTYVAGKNTSKLYPQFIPSPTDPLAALSSGLRIPFDREAGSARLGWYYTNEQDFKNKNDGFKRLAVGQTSNFIIVEGPDSDIDDHFYWLRDVNSIPSDFYYQSIIGPNYSQAGNHDFDLNNNGIYGQFYWDNSGDHSLDGVDWAVDVFVGRASVDSGVQAQAFVDKVLTYEKLEDSAGVPLNTAYLRKVIYASALWYGWHQHSVQADITIPPDEGRYTHAAGTTETHMHLNFDVTMSGGVTSHQMVARAGNSDTVIPYNTLANSTHPGWYFCTNANYNTLSLTATRFVRIWGPQALINPNHFVWDVAGLEQSAAEKEDLRGRMNSWYPQFSDVQRHYDDYFDLGMPPALGKLDSNALKNSIEQGCHFLSLTGHGWSGGCCGIDVNVQNYANTNQYFVAFADSCSTARIDASDSAAEVLTNDADGGAITYVGNTRYSWIGVGDNFERFFWSKLSITGRAGVAAGLRLSSGGARWPWVIYAQNLFGDPEMPVYTEVPALLQVTHATAAHWGHQLAINVKLDGDALANATVTIMAGWRGGLARPQVLASKKTNAYGNAGFTLPEKDGNTAQRIQITVSKKNCKPYNATIDLTETKLRERIASNIPDAFSI